MDIIFWMPVILMVACVIVPIYIWLDWEYGLWPRKNGGI